MLPVVAGRAATTRQILIYSALLVPASVLPWVLGFAGSTYAAAVVVCGTIFIGFTVQLRLSRATDTRPAQRVFAFSIFYLFVLFAALRLRVAASIEERRRFPRWRLGESGTGTIPSCRSRLGHATRPSSSLVKTDGV